MPAPTPATRLSLPLWTETYAAPHLPASRAEMTARGWDCVDVVFVTGDAYVDHPSFAMAILGRVLEAAGFRVAILSEPVRRSILLDCKADLLVYGMAEKTIIEIAKRLAQGQTTRDLRDLRGVAFALGASETRPRADGAKPTACAPWEPDAIILPSFE